MELTAHHIALGHGGGEGRTVFGIGDDIFDNLLEYQKMMIKRPAVKSFSFDITYDFPEYFHGIYTGNIKELKKNNLTITIKDEKSKDNYPDYARETVWYGRKGGRITYKEEMKIIVKNL